LSPAPGCARGRAGSGAGGALASPVGLAATALVIAEPYQPPARVRVTAAMVRDILLAAGLTEHQPGTEGFLITEQPDGRIRVEPPPAGSASCGARR